MICLHQITNLPAPDITSIEPLLNNTLINIDHNNININADKAYISKKNHYYKDINVNIITPKKVKTIKQSNKQIKKLNADIENQRLKEC